MLTTGLGDDCTAGSVTIGGILAGSVTVGPLLALFNSLYSQKFIRKLTRLSQVAYSAEYLLTLTLCQFSRVSLVELANQIVSISVNQ